MITANAIRSEIDNLCRALLQADIALVVNPIVSERVGTNQRVTWRTLGKSDTKAFYGDFASLDSYCEWVKQGAFSAILYDGSLLQLSYELSGTAVVKHRLAFLPSPCDFDSALLYEQNIQDMVASYPSLTASELKLRSPIRFDFDSNAAAEEHSSVHLTLLWDHCRCPVAAPLSVGHFVRFVFQNFYPSLYVLHKFLREWPLHRFKRTITETQQSRLHLSSIDS